MGMKTAISIPNEVFRDAESLARQLKVSRSQLYSRAISEYVARHATDLVTESLDRLFSELDEGPDPFVSAAARRILGTVVITGMFAATMIAVFLIPLLFVLVERLANGGSSGPQRHPSDAVSSEGAS